MAVGAHRQRGRSFRPATPRAREVKRGGRRAALLGSICAGVLLVAFATSAAAQQTVIIGGGVPVIGGGGSGVVINNEVLDSLGPAPHAPALPYQAPAALPAMSSVPGIAYRQPNTGLLMVTRPGTLLFPPPVFPKSKMTVRTPAAPGLAQAPRKAAAAPKLQSRLLVPPAPKAAEPAVKAPPAPAPKMAPAPVAPVTQKPVAAPEPPPKVAELPPPAPPPKAAEPKPAKPEPEPQVAATPAPSQPMVAPPPSPLIRELKKKPAPVPAPSPDATREAKVEPEPPPKPEPPASPAPPATVEAEPEPPPAPAKSLTEKPAAKPQTAALPPAGALVEQVSVLFQEGSAVLNAAAKGQLKSVATFLEANATVRVQLLAYAKATAESPSRARRLSLSRALAVRAFLIEQGVRSTRMDVRALGDKVPDGPVDRVDVLPQAANQ